MRSACGSRASPARVQAIAVTHAPQVAARADRHYVIAKDALDKGKRVATRVTEVAADRRREEIARMLAGAEITAGGPRRGGTADQRRRARLIHRVIGRACSGHPRV